MRLITNIFKKQSVQVKTLLVLLSLITIIIGGMEYEIITSIIRLFLNPAIKDINYKATILLIIKYIIIAFIYYFIGKKYIKQNKQLKIFKFVVTYLLFSIGILLADEILRNLTYFIFQAFEDCLIMEDIKNFIIFSLIVVFTYLISILIYYTNFSIKNLSLITQTKVAFSLKKIKVLIIPIISYGILQSYITHISYDRLLRDFSNQNNIMSFFNEYDQTQYFGTQQGLLEVIVKVIVLLYSAYIVKETNNNKI